MGGSKLGSTVGRGRGWEEDLAPTLINLGSVTVSDWFLLASLPTLPRLLRLPKSFLPLPPPPPLLVPQKLYTPGTSLLCSPPPLHPLILMIIPPIRIEAGSVGRGALISFGITQGVSGGGTLRAQLMKATP